MALGTVIPVILQVWGLLLGEVETKVADVILVAASGIFE